MSICVIFHVFLGPCGIFHPLPQGHLCPLTNGPGPELVHVNMVGGGGGVIVHLYDVFLS